MSSKSIKVVCEEKCLNIIYSPAINFDVIEKNINDGTWIKGTFWVNKTNIVEINQDDESICFTIAKLKKITICLIEKYLELSIIFQLRKS